MQILTREIAAKGPDDVDNFVLRRAYAGRGITDAAELDRSLQSLLLPAELPDIDVAAVRLADAVEQGESILIVGDFDADGATSVALCMLLLNNMAAAQVDYLVPNRFEFGYGLSPEIVELAATKKPNIIVTVDNGVSSVAGVDRATEHGIDVIVTDHHLPGAQLPKALALVNPNLDNCSFASKSMAGVGVAYYVLSRLRSELKNRDWFNDQRPMPNLGQYLDLVALGTVADVVPLDHNNRVLVYQGLQRIRSGKCLPGIKALAEVGKRNLATMSAQDLGFALGPRLNAAGRLEDMSIGIKCLMAPDFPQARQMAVALDQLNVMRRQLEQDMVGDAELMLADSQTDDSRSGLTVYDESFHQGVVGIVAGRLRERHHKPVIAFADAGDVAPDELKGSARSIDNLHIRDVLDWVAASHPGLLLKFGGHAMAAGMSIKRVHYERFGVIFDKAVKRFASEEILQAKIITDGELAPVDMTLETAEAIADGGPWGSAFPEPMFHGQFRIVNQRVVGENHLKMTLQAVLADGQSVDLNVNSKTDSKMASNKIIDAIAFRQAPLPNGTQTITVVYKLSVNDYGQWPTLQLMVEYLEAD